MKSTEIRFNVSKAPKKLTVKVNGKNNKLKEVNSLDAFNTSENVYFYDAQPNLNQFATKGSEFEKVPLVKNPMLLVRLAKQDVSSTAIEVQLEGFEYAPADNYLVQTGALTSPKAVITDQHTQAYTLTPSWKRLQMLIIMKLNSII